MVKFIAAACLGLAIAGCVAAPEPPRTPVRWQLVEKHYRDLPGATTAGDGQVAPDALVLAFQPIYADDFAPDLANGDAGIEIELVSLFPGRSAGTDEPVTLTVRVRNADPRMVYRISAKTTQAWVQMLGDDTHIVRGAEPATFQFTANVAGRGGLSLAVGPMHDR